MRKGVLVLALWVVFTLPAPAFAHSDFPIAAGEFAVAAGGEMSLPLSVHYHRVVGEFQSAGPPAGVQFLLEDARGNRTPLAGPASEGKLNHLIPCCKDATYTPYRLILANASAAPAAVQLRAHLVHDDLAVVAHNGEPGATVQTGLIFGLLAVWMAYRLRKGAPQAAAGRWLPRWAASGLALFLLALTGALGASLLGIYVYGGGPVDGVVTAAVLLPVPPGPFGSAGSVLMLLLMLPWLAAMILWTRATARDCSDERNLLRLAGMVMAGGSLLVSLLIGLRFGALSPVLIALPVVLVQAGYILAGHLFRPGSQSAHPLP